jgi:hypothetical protein
MAKKRVRGNESVKRSVPITPAIGNKPVSKEDRKRKADHKGFRIFAYRAADLQGETMKTAAVNNQIPVTVHNISKHNCVGGTVTLNCTPTGETAATTFGVIADGQQITKQVAMASWPDEVGWYFKSDDGIAWGPSGRSYPGGTSSVLLPLNPFRN